MNAKEAGLFVILSLIVSLGVFREAMWGAKFLAPLDILPKTFSHFQFMTGSTGGIPDNHHIIDQITYDVPLQYIIYQSVHEGHIPWWDPYTYGGRPLLADAHINGTDPWRLLCYLTMPFEWAYNWNLILKSILTGLGMFLLLRHFQSAPVFSGVFALTYQFAGCFAVFFGHPWIQGSFLYFPFIWMVWDRGLTKNPLGHCVAASLLTAFVFYSGNLQSHMYLPLFAFAFLAGVWLTRSGNPVRAFLLVTASGCIGAALAAPVLLNQMEFYLLSTRALAQGWSLHEALKGPMSLAGIFPWALGTFRTIDLSKVVGSGSLGFTLFIGTSGGILALMGIQSVLQNYRRMSRHCCTSLILVVGYLLLISTPLDRVLYTRSSALAVMGIMVLAASGCLMVLSGPVSAFRRWGYGILAVSALALLVLQGALAFYPRFEPMIRREFLQRVEAKESALNTQELRLFQVASFPREVGVGNPEVALAFLSAFALGAALIGSGRFPRERLLQASMLLALGSVLLFYSRYVPSHPTALWNRLLLGGPSQQAAMEAARPGSLRILEESKSLQDMVFPNALGALYRVHTVHGYSALQPRSIFRYPAGAPEIPASWIADLRINERGEIQQAGLPPQTTSRLQWDPASGRRVSIIRQELNRLTLSVSPGQAGELIWTDTYYPGWQMEARNGKQESWVPLEPCFTKFFMPTSTQTEEWVLSYRPRFLNMGWVIAAGGLIAMIMASVWIYSSGNRGPVPAGRS